MSTGVPTGKWYPPATAHLDSMPSVLSAEDRQHFRTHGYLLLPGYFAEVVTQRLHNWVLDLQTWPETPGRWMMYFETLRADQEKEERMLCRLENFLEYHGGFMQLLTHPALMAILEQLFDEPAILYKEKINFKFPCGQGFTPHQDAPAFATFGQKYHITAMISIDPGTARNGCLEVVRDMGLRQLLPQAADGSIRADVAQAMDWQPLRTEPGDLLLFDSYLPHRSGPNQSAGPRRSLFVTYGARSGGDRRADYYTDKRLRFPPECERVPGRDYSAGAALYNLANPIRG